jgi:hypothetical protein
MLHVHHSRGFFPRIVCLVLATAAAGAVPAAAGPALSLLAQEVDADGMTPGGVVVWFGMGREALEYSAAHSELQEAALADGQGHAALPVPAGVPEQSIWVAVDLKTGAYVQASPAGFAPGGFQLGGGALNLGAGSAADKLLDPADVIQVLLVRPGQGAWAATIGRGGPRDEADPAESSLKVSFGNLDPLVPGVPAPAKLAPKDLVVVTHPRTMAIGILTIG